MEEIAAPTETAGGLHIPAGAMQDLKRTSLTLYRIIAVGQGRRKPKSGEYHGLSVAVGDAVWLNGRAPDTVEFNGREYAMVHEDAILAIVDQKQIEDKLLVQ